MDDDYILSHGGTEDDIRQIAEDHGATDPICPHCQWLHHHENCPELHFIDPTNVYSVTILLNHYVTRNGEQTYTYTIPHKVNPSGDQAFVLSYEPMLRDEAIAFFKSQQAHLNFPQ